VFACSHCPGDPAAVDAGDQATPADVERIRQSLGLDRPFLVRFGEWVWQILHGDLGTSIFTEFARHHHDGAALRAGRCRDGNDALHLVAVPCRPACSRLEAGTLIDRLIMAFAVFGFSVAVFVIAYLLAFLFALQLEWLPVQGLRRCRKAFGRGLRT